MDNIKPKMKTKAEMEDEMERCKNIIDVCIQKQKRNEPLSDFEKSMRQEAGQRINTLLWVLGEMD